MRISRRVFTGGAAGLSAALILRNNPAHSAEFNFRFGIQIPDTHPTSIRVQEAAALIREQTNGRVDIRVFPNGQLGSEADMLSQVRNGAIQMMTTSPIAGLMPLIPKAAITGVGFAFKSYDEVWAAMDGVLGAAVRAEVSKAGLVVLEKSWDSGYRHVTTRAKPVVTPSDLQGVKIRVPMAPLWTSMFKAFGAGPIGIPFGEVYSALQTHLADAQENPLALIDTAKFYEVQKYCSLTSHMWDGFWLIANPRAMDQLPADVREIVVRNFNQAAIAERADVKQQNDTLRAALEKKGLAFNTPETAPFREKLKQAGFYSEWREKFGADLWEKLEAVVGNLS
jgi:tripartite ATP-independent transporter DctP family solute receptor